MHADRYDPKVYNSERMSKDSIRIKTSLGAEFNSEVLISGEKYIVQTEAGSEKNPVAKTRVYLKGRIIYTRETDYVDLMNAPDRDLRVREIMDRQHSKAISILKAEKLRAERTPNDYIDEVKGFLKDRKHAEALRAVTDGLEQHPGNPFLLSYYGFLQAEVNRNFREGIEVCRRALEGLNERVPFGEEFFYPVFYLNLGRAYLAAGKKREAVAAFNRGLRIDSEDWELLAMMEELGTRRSPVFSFLRRSHFLNRYLGKFLHRPRR